MYHNFKFNILRSGSDPLVLSEEKREMRKQQRIEELRNSSGLPPLMRQDR